MQERDVRNWLKSMRILHKQAKVGSCGANATSAADSESECEESERVAVELDWRQPCTICGRTYPHEHKRAVRASSVADSEESD